MNEQATTSQAQADGPRLEGWDNTLMIGCVMVCEDCGFRHDQRPVRLFYIPSDENGPACILPACNQCSDYERTQLEGGHFHHEVK